jgi:hypothetical protein
MTIPRRTALLVVVTALAAMLAGCSATGSAAPPVLKPVPARTGAPYSASLSGVSITLLRPAALGSKPNDTSANFVSFQSTANANDYVRLLVPATVCVDGSATPSAAPSDFVGYLHSLTPLGATIKDEDSISIDGVSGTELTLGGTRDIQGSIGQSKGDGCADENSFGVASDLSLRMAVFDVHNKVVLIWARTDANSPTAGFFSTYQKMLQTVTFG